MNRNFHKRLDRIIDSLDGRRPTLLLHSCCGPCSSYVLEVLREYFDITVLFYGPNIQPREEYDKRLAHQRTVLEHFGIKILECEYDGPAFDEAVKGLENEPEGGARCSACYALRMSETARRAKEGGFEYFCTTLSVSPHKDSMRINLIGMALEKQLGVKWLPSDFKKRGGFDRSLELSDELGLYRQEYCGCRYSLGGE